MGLMFLQGSLALIQTIFLPGLLLLRLFNLRKGGVIQNLVFCVGLSLLVNYCVILILTALSLYFAWVIYLLFLIEYVLAFFLYWPSLTKSFGEVIAKNLASARDWFISIFRKIDAEQEYSKVLAAFLVLSVALVFVYLSLDSLAWFYKLFRSNIGEVFKLWDAIVSWNPWAKVWAQNQIPLAGHYPQLIPINWSLAYVLMGNSQVQFFAVGIMPLFPIFTLLLIFDLGISFQSAGYFIGLVILRYMLKKFMLEYITDGYVDLAVMFMGFLAIYCLLKGKEQNFTQDRLHYLWIGALAAAGAAVTKQAGLFLLVAYPILAYLLMFQGTEEDTSRKKARHIFQILLVMLVIVLPWYIFAQIQIWRGNMVSEIPFVTKGIYGNRMMIDRFLGAVRSLQVYIITFALPLLVLPLLKKTQRFLVLGVAIPYGIIWAFYFSYRIRNLSLAFPIACVTTGFALESLLSLSSRLIPVLHLDRLKVVFIFPLFLVGLVLLSLSLPGSFLIDRQLELQKGLIYPKLNDNIYAVLEKQPPGSRILTNYPLNFLPGLENTLLYNPLDNIGTFQDALQQNADVRLFLLRKDGNKQIYESIRTGLDKGAYDILFQEGGWIMVEKK